MAENDTIAEETQDQGPETPVCLRCLQPVDPVAHICPNCGEAIGQLTPYLPLESVPWQAQIWGRAWQQLWSRNVSIPGRLLRLFMILWGAPVLLIDLFFRLLRLFLILWDAPMLLIRRFFRGKHDGSAQS